MRPAKPYVIECVDLASKRTAAEVHGEMKRGLFSLAAISATAPLIGFFGTILGILSSFRSFGSSKSAILAGISERLSEAMIPTLLGFLVAIPAFWFYKYLSGQVEVFDREMANASSDLINRLLVHLGRLKNADKVRWTALTGASVRTELPRSSAVEHPHSTKTPCFSIGRIYENGLSQLVWPRLDSDLDAEVILDAGMWVSFAYGLLGWLTYFNQDRPIAGSFVFAFFAVSAMGVRAGSVGAVLGICAFLAFACLACLIPFEAILPALCLAGAPVLLLGSLRAAKLETRVKPWWTALEPLPGVLLSLLGFSASTAVLLGTAFALYPTGGNYSMEPTLHNGDWIVSANASLAGTVHYGQLVVFRTHFGELGTERVAGLPGDRIQVDSGKLIRNGKLVDETYSHQPYRGGLGDFPLPSEAFPNEYIGWKHYDAYGDRLKRGKPYVVPEGSIFLLNDNRNNLEDSRIFGPVWDSNVVGRPLLAYNPLTNPWSLPRVVR